VREVEADKYIVFNVEEILDAVLEDISKHLEAGIPVVLKMKAGCSRRARWVRHMYWDILYDKYGDELIENLKLSDQEGTACWFLIK